MDRNVIYAFQFRTLVSFFFFLDEIECQEGEKTRGEGETGLGCGVRADS